MVNSLELNKHYKNLKEICEVLKLQYKDSTNSRKAILKEIECYYKLEKKGRGYIVKEIYDTPKVKEDKRKNNGGHMAHTKYDLLMDNLLINWLYITDEQVVDITFNDLFGESKDRLNIPLLTSDYKDLLDIGYEQFAKELSIRKDLVDVYTEKLRKIIVKCLETALGRLQKQNIIIWSKEIKVKYFDLEVEIVDNILKEEIKQKEQEVYNDENINITPYQRKNPNINKQFKSEVYKKLIKHSIASYWNVYVVEILDWDKIIKIDDAEEIKKDISNRFMKSIHKSVINKKYGTKVDNPNGIGKIRTNEYHPFNSTEHLENINELNKIFFVDYQKKDWVDLWDEILNEEWT